MTLQGARQRIRHRSVACVVAVCAVAVAACGSTAPATPILTLTQARAAAQSYGRVDSQASAQCSPTLNDTVESGDLAAIDDAGDFNPAVCAVRGTPAAPPPSTTPAPIPDDELVVPRTTSYPIFFMQYANADLGHGDGSQPNIWVLESQKRGAPWKAVRQVQLSAGGLLTFRRNAEGFAPAPLAATSAPGYRVTPAATCDLAARYFTDVYSGSATPGGLADPSNIAHTVSTYRDDDTLMTTQDDVVSSRTWTCRGSEVAEPTKDGSALVVFTLRGDYVFTPPTTEKFWLNISYVGGKTVTLVPPGLYRHAGATELMILAALVPPSRANTAPTLIGSYNGIVGTTSTPA